MPPSYPFEFGNPTQFPPQYTDVQVSETYAVVGGPVDPVGQPVGTGLQNFLSVLCSTNPAGQWPIRFYNGQSGSLYTDLYNEGFSAVPGWTSPGTGRIRIISGLIWEESFVTLILPPTCDQTMLGGSPPPLTYRHPLIVQGAYDVNANLFDGFGEAQLIVHLVGESASGSRKGAIGVIWNGGAHFGSASATALDRDHFSNIVDIVHNSARGDRSKLYMLGKSRAATTALIMASNPRPHNYTVKYVAAIAPGTRFGEHSEVIGATIPGQLRTPGLALGLMDAWRPGWTYPAGGHPALVGKGGSTALRHVLFGAWLSALDVAGTKVVMLVGTHDEFIPFGHQIEYIRKAQSTLTNAAVEGNIVIGGGHLRYDALFIYSHRFRNAVMHEMDTGMTIGIGTGVTYYRHETNNGFTSLGSLPDVPFTFQIPYKVYAGQPLHAFITGPSGLHFEAYSNIPVFAGTIAAGRNFLVSAPSTVGLAGTTITFTLVRYRLSPSHPWVNMDLSKVTGCVPQATPISTTVLAMPPVPPPGSPTVTGYDAYQALRVPAATRCYEEIGWGLAQYRP